MTPILIVGGIIAVVAAIGFVAYQQEKKRTEALRQTAAELGFDFLPQGDTALLGRLAGFHLFSQGRSQTVANLMRGATADLEVAIFDYRYVTGSGKNQHTWKQTVAGFFFPGGNLPHFSLRPETVWHKIGSWMGYQDIDFASHPVFSRKFLLRGQDEDAIRHLFTDDVLEFFEGHTGLSVEASDGRLIVYRHAKRADPDSVRALLEEGFRVLGLIRRPAG